MIMHWMLALAVCSSFAFAQDQPTFRVDVQLVRMLATVKDANGSPIGGMTKEEFVLSDNGVRQQIALFERHTSQPLSVGILLDISGSTAKEMRYQTEAVLRFVNALFNEGNPDDRAALYTFNWQVTRNAPYTRSLSRFQSELKSLRAEAGTSMYDAILLASDDIADRDGRHVLVLVSDGGDTVSNTTFHQALEAAHKADVVLYPILTMPILNDAGRNIGGENALTLIAETTGGKLFSPGLNGLDHAFADILKDLRTQYLIGFYPRGVPVTKERFHRIEIKTTRPDLRVVTRTGYYGEFDAAAGKGGMSSPSSNDISRPRGTSQKPKPQSK
jgi:Ca-activated chloride channel family protein